MGDFESMMDLGWDSSKSAKEADNPTDAHDTVAEDNGNEVDALEAKSPSGPDHEPPASKGESVGAERNPASGATTVPSSHNRITTTVIPSEGASQMPEGAVKLGKGLDIGTANIVSAIQNDKGGITIQMERNAFIDIKSDVYSKKMLTQLKVPYVMYNDKMIVIGDAAFELSNIFGRETRRPMRDGLISPDEVDALPMIRLIIEKVLGVPQAEEENLYFSVPAASIDRQNNIIYHQGLFEGMLRKMGYRPKALNEGHAVVFAELAEQDFTGIGISCGGGMVNVCVCYKTIPAVTFSISRGGDWIDKNVANVLGINATKATFLKEQGVDLTRPRNREEEAIVIYYRNLINYILQNIRSRFEVTSDIPEFRDPIEIVASGGTSMIQGFEEVFADELQKVKLPLKISCVRRASEPLTSVAKGCLIAAAISDPDE
jgi:actin-like ATPase involved in cell morphogenesis